MEENLKKCPFCGEEPRIGSLDGEEENNLSN